MRVLGITETCDLGSLYLRLLGDGHEVRISVSEPLAQGTMAGLVPRVDDWRAELDWIREAGRDGVLVFEAVGFGALQDQLRRQGFNVIGGSAFGDRLENDRAFAFDLLGRARAEDRPRPRIRQRGGGDRGSSFAAPPLCLQILRFRR